MADVGRKAIAHVEGVTTRLLQRHLPEERARESAHALASGIWTHDHPPHARELGILGVPVRIGVEAPERRLMTLYPQPRGREPAVEYVPVRPVPTFAPRRELPRGSRQD